MVKASLRVHPPVLFCYGPNHVELIIRAENYTKGTCWVEAEIIVPEKLSLSPENQLGKGRIRIGILDKKEFLEKSVKVYANVYTNPQIYRCIVTLFFYDKNGVIAERLDKSIDVRCELKKKAVI